MLTDIDKQILRDKITHNQHEIFVLSLDEMDHVIKKWIKNKKNLLSWSHLKIVADKSSNYFATGKDISLLRKIFSELGYAGTRAYIRTYGGKAHIIFKGYPGLRNILTGTKYGIENAQIIKMGIGKYGAIEAVKSGAKLTIILVSAYRVADYLLTDSATLSQLIGTLATDVVKIGIATGASILAASAISAIGTYAPAAILIGSALTPLVVVIVVGLATGAILTHLDNKFNITNKLIAALEEVSEKGIQVILDEKKSILQKTDKAINNTVDSIIDSVIDYAIEKAEDSLTSIIDQLLRRSPILN